jgi:hypothetical protein
MTNIAMENPNHKWRFLAGEIIYFYGQFSMAMLNSHRVNGGKLGRTHKLAIEEWVNYGGMGRFYTQQLYPPITTIRNNTYKYLNEWIIHNYIYILLIHVNPPTNN